MAKRCMSCGAENKDDAKYCRKCGKRLALACPECGAEVEQDDEFCSNCGHKLGGDAEQPESEAQKDRSKEKTSPWGKSWEKFPWVHTTGGVVPPLPFPQFIKNLSEIMGKKDDAKEDEKEDTVHCDSCGREFSRAKEEAADAVCEFCNRKLSDIRKAVGPIFDILEEQKKK